jgi:hypothetical protein
MRYAGAEWRWDLVWICLARVLFQRIECCRVLWDVAVKCISETLHC